MNALEEQSCPVINRLDELIAQLRIREDAPIPEEAPSGYVPPLLAKARHELTNYDEVVSGLSLCCLQYMEAGGQCSCLEGECDTRVRMAWAIRQAANDLGLNYWRRLYERT